MFTKTLQMMLKEDLTYQTMTLGPLPVGIIKKVIRLMKNELVGKIMTEFAGPRTYSYLIYDGGGDKKANITKNCIVKWRLTFEYNKNVQKKVK